MSLTAIRDQVAADLNDATLVTPILAQGVYLPQKSLDDVLGPVAVSVVGLAEQTVLASRGVVIVEYAIQVAVQQKLVAGTLPEADLFVALTEQISKWFFDHPLTGRSERQIRTELTVAWSPEHMDKHKLFTSVCTLTFKGQG